MKTEKNEREMKGNKQAGYTLLEYVAGASILLGIVYVGLNNMGTSLKNVFESIGEWATEQTGQMKDMDQEGDESTPPPNL